MDSSTFTFTMDRESAFRVVLGLAFDGDQRRDRAEEAQASGRLDVARQYLQAAEKNYALADLLSDQALEQHPGEFIFRDRPWRISDVERVRLRDMIHAFYEFTTKENL